MVAVEMKIQGRIGFLLFLVFVSAGMNVEKRKRLFSFQFDEFKQEVDPSFIFVFKKGFWSGGDAYALKMRIVIIKEPDFLVDIIREVVDHSFGKSVFFTEYICDLKQVDIFLLHHICHCSLLPFALM